MASYAAIHMWLAYNFPKAGVCEECQRPARRTAYAVIHGRPYSRDREDYRELCPRCHNRYDSAKLTTTQVAEIREKYVPGVRGGVGMQPNSQASLAKEYGVTRAAIQAILRGRSWQI